MEYIKTLVKTKNKSIDLFFYCIKKVD